MRPNDLKKGYYKLYDDAPTKADKEREAGLAKELSKKDKKPVKAVVKIKAEKPLTDKEKERGIIGELEKEDFYGDKKKQEKFNKIAKEAILEMKTKEAYERLKKSPIMRYKK